MPNQPNQPPVIKPGLRFEIWDYKHTVKERRDKYSWVVLIEGRKRQWVLYETVLRNLLAHSECKIIS